MTKYKWGSPHEWLSEKILLADIEDCQHIARRLVAVVTADEIQDLFQLWMEEDGYFDDT